MSFKFSVCHPTARVNPKDPLFWVHSCYAFYDQCDNPEDVEYVLVVHESNWRACLENEGEFSPIITDLKKKWGRFTVVRNSGTNRSLAQGRKAIEASTGQIIIGSMDDLFPPEHWDTLISEAFLQEAATGKGGYANPKVLHVSSGSQGDQRTFIPQIFTRARLQQSPFPHPDYWSMYADCEFTELAVKDRVVIEAPHIQFQHKHFSLGTAQMDSVYQETNSKEAFEHDWGVFMRRRASGFPMDIKQHNPREDAAHVTGGSAPEQSGESEVRPARAANRPLFSILHTSSRPDKWRAVYDDWMSKATRPGEVEYVLCVDQRWGFRDEASGGMKTRHPLTVVWNDSRYKYSGYVSGVNLAAEASNGHILIVVADDQFACEGWDEELIAVMERLAGSKYGADPARWPDGVFSGDRSLLPEEFVIEVSTNTVNEHERGIFVMPILSSTRYEQLGYVFYPAYESMYADNDLCEQAREDGVVIDARHLVFPHGHPLIPIESGKLDPKSEKGQAHLRETWDKSYQAQHQDGAYQLGEFILARRRTNGFTDLQCSICQAKFGEQHAPSCRRTGPVEILTSGETGAPGSRTIAWCLPFQNCSAGWFVAALDLYHHMQASGFNVIVTNAQSSECFVSREVIRKAVMNQTPRADFLLWQDSDNLISPAQFDMLMLDLASYPDLMMVSGWYRLTPGSEGKVSTCVAQLVDGDMRMVDEADLVNAAGLIDTQWHGFGGVLMRYEVLEKVGDKPFAPLPAPNSPYGVTGEDTAFCMRARQAGCKIAIDPRVFLPHLKLGELGPRPRQGVSTIPLSKMSVQTMAHSALPQVNAPASNGIRTTDGDSGKSTDRESPRIVACLRVKNEGRWIRRVLRSLYPLCSRILVLDNESTDNTLDEIQEARRDGKVRIDLEIGLAGSDEGSDRQKLLEQARAIHADWILNIDGDEELAQSAAARLLGKDGHEGILTNPAHQHVTAWHLKVEYLWDGLNQIRADRWYRDVWMPRLFRVTPELSFSSIKNGIHTRVQGLVGPTYAIQDIPLWHYGYMLKSDRLAKWRFYNAVDPNNDAEDRYRHIVQGDFPSIPASAVLKMAGPLELKRITNGPVWTAEEWERLSGDVTPQSGDIEAHSRKTGNALEVALL